MQNDIKKQYWYYRKAFLFVWNWVIVWKSRKSLCGKGIFFGGVQKKEGRLLYQNKRPFMGKDAYLDTNAPPKRKGGAFLGKGVH